MSRFPRSRICLLVVSSLRTPMVCRAPVAYSCQPGDTSWTSNLLKAACAKGLVPDGFQIHIYPADANDATLHSVLDNIGNATSFLDRTVMQTRGHGQLAYAMTEFAVAAASFFMGRITSCRTARCNCPQATESLYSDRERSVTNSTIYDVGYGGTYTAAIAVEVGSHNLTITNIPCTVPAETRST